MNGPLERGNLRQATRLIVGGLLIAFSPLLIALAGSIFVDNPFDESTSSLGVLLWLMVLTMPIGAIMVIIGLVIGLDNVLRRRS
jgi:TRAP-type C4-dicarboxylate transport system permease small subunit